MSFNVSYSILEHNQGSQLKMKKKLPQHLENHNNKTEANQIKSIKKKQ